MSDPTITHLMAGQPTRFSARNFRGIHRRRKSGSVWLVELEVERPIWDTLDTMPDGAMCEVVLWMTDGEKSEEQPVEKPKKQKEPSPFGLYWREWLKEDRNGAALIFNIQLIDALKLDGEPATKDSIHEALHAALGVFSLSREVSPDRFEAWLSERKLEGLVTRSRQIVAKLEEHAQAS